jgi:hypothetical protein
MRNDIRSASVTSLSKTNLFNGVSPHDTNTKRDPANSCDLTGDCNTIEAKLTLYILCTLTGTLKGCISEHQMQPCPWTESVLSTGGWQTHSARSQFHVFCFFKFSPPRVNLAYFQTTYLRNRYASNTIEGMFDNVQNKHYAGQYLNQPRSKVRRYNNRVNIHHCRRHWFTRRVLVRPITALRDLGEAFELNWHEGIYISISTILTTKMCVVFSKIPEISLSVRGFFGQGS